MGGIKWTIKDGIVYDAKQLLADVRGMVDRQKQDVQDENPGDETADPLSPIGQDETGAPTAGDCLPGEKKGDRDKRLPKAGGDQVTAGTVDR